MQFVAEAPLPELPSFAPWDWLVELAYRPGVTDTLALTAREAIGIAGGACLRTRAPARADRAPLCRKGAGRRPRAT